MNINALSFGCCNQKAPKYVEIGDTVVDANQIFAVKNDGGYYRIVGYHGGSVTAMVGDMHIPIPEEIKKKLDLKV